MQDYSQVQVKDLSEPQRLRLFIELQTTVNATPVVTYAGPARSKATSAFECGLQCLGPNMQDSGDLSLESNTLPVLRSWQ